MAGDIRGHISARARQLSLEDEASHCGYGWKFPDWCAGGIDEPFSAMQVSVKFSQGDERLASPKLQDQLPRNVSRVDWNGTRTDIVGTERHHYAHRHRHHHHHHGNVTQAVSLSPYVVAQSDHDPSVHVRQAVASLTPLVSGHTPEGLNKFTARNQMEAPLVAQVRVISELTLFVLIVAMLVYAAFDYYIKWQGKRRHHAMLDAIPPGHVITLTAGAPHTGQIATPYSMAPHASRDWRSRLSWQHIQPRPMSTGQTPELQAAIALAAAGS